MLEMALNDLGELGDATYTTAISKNAFGAVEVEIKKGSKTSAGISFAEGNSGTYFVDYADRKARKSFDTVIASFHDGADRGECIAYISLALIMVVDSSLDFDDALDLVYDLPDVDLGRNGSGSNSVEKNGIEYTLNVRDGYWSLCVCCSEF